MTSPTIILPVAAWLRGLTPSKDQPEVRAFIAWMEATHAPDELIGASDFSQAASLFTTHWDGQWGKPQE